MAVAWLAAGLVVGVVLSRDKPLARTAAAGLVGGLLLLFASDAAFALTRNLRLDLVLRDRTPGLGAFIEGLLFAAGAALPGSIRSARRLVQRGSGPERRPPAAQCA